MVYAAFVSATKGRNHRIAVLISIIVSQVLLSFYQYHRIHNPKWRAQDEIVHEDNYIEWKEAVEIVKHGKVVTVMQDHSRVVSIILKDGSHFVTLEPSIDDVYEAIEQCGKKCNEIAIWTE